MVVVEVDEMVVVEEAVTAVELAGRHLGAVLLRRERELERLLAALELRPIHVLHPLVLGARRRRRLRLAGALARRRRAVLRRSERVL